MTRDIVRMRPRLEATDGEQKSFENSFESQSALYYRPRAIPIYIFDEMK